jgi:hypothetical protein
MRKILFPQTTLDFITAAIKYLKAVIPASGARRESFLKTRKDSGQAGMTMLKEFRLFTCRSNKVPLKR